MPQSDLQNHYEVSENEYGYQFTTSAGVLYYLTFIAYPPISDFLATGLYMFNIERAVSGRLGQHDDRVRNTVLYVLDLFFQAHEDALITICDISDNKQAARKRLFDSWFRQFNDHRLIRLDEECLIDDVPTSVSLFFSVSHPNRLNLYREFRQLAAINFYND